MDTFSRDGLRFDVHDAGPDQGDIVVLLHGFPQQSSSWDAVVPALHAAGLRTLAPDQRGYSPGARPRGRRAYRVDELVADVAALVEAAGGAPVHVVGHDWGAIAAWAFASQRPDLTRTLTALSVPHPAAFLGAMGSSRQALASWYMAAFQLPGLPERYLDPATPGGRARLVAQLVHAGQTRERAERDVTGLGDRAGLAGGLAWYRALPFSSPGQTRTRVTVPTTFAWSDGDVAITRRAAELCERWVTGTYRFEVLEGVSHWIPDERPDTVAALVLDRIGQAGTDSGSASSG